MMKERTSPATARRGPTDGGDGGGRVQHQRHQTQRGCAESRIRRFQPDVGRLLGRARAAARRRRIPRPAARCPAPARRCGRTARPRTARTAVAASLSSCDAASGPPSARGAVRPGHGREQQGHRRGQAEGQEHPHARGTARPTPMASGRAAISSTARGCCRSGNARGIAHGERLGDAAAGGVRTTRRPRSRRRR